MQAEPGLDRRELDVAKDRAQRDVAVARARRGGLDDRRCEHRRRDPRARIREQDEPLHLVPELLVELVATDAAEVIYKNNKAGVHENVWADVSGLVVGSAADFERYRQQGTLKSVKDTVYEALDFAERYDRILYGSDWPLAPMAVYRDFIREIVPKEHQRAVFYENAKALFRLS